MMANGISEEEFTQLQNQFLELKSINYGLEDKNKKQAAAVADLEARRQRAAAEAARLQAVVDRSRRARDTEQLVAANLSLEKKLASQEDEFRLQNQTLLQELATYVAENERLTTERDALHGAQPPPPPAADAAHLQELLHVRAEAAALRAEAAAAAARHRAELDDLRRQVAALTDANVQLERACRPPSALSGGGGGGAEAPDADDCVEVGADGAEVSYRRAAASAHQLLRGAQERVTQLQTDIQQFADIRLELETTRRELALCQEQMRRQHDRSASGGELAELRQKLGRKQESYQALQAEMETSRQNLEAEIAALKQQRERDADEARARTQRYQTQLSNGYSVLKTERQQAAAAIRTLNERLDRLQAAAGGGDPTPAAAAAAADRLAEAEAQLSAARNSLAEREAAAARAEAARAEVEAERAEAEAARAAVEQQRDLLERRLAELEKTLTDVQAECHDASALATKRKSVLDEMAAHIESLTAEHAEQLRAAGAAQRAAQADADAGARRLQELEAAVESAELARVQTADQLQQAQLDAQQLQRRHDQLLQQHAEQLQLLRAETQQLRAEHEQRTRELSETHRAEMQDVSTQLEISSALLAESRDQAAALRQQLSDAGDERRIHQRRGADALKDLRRQLAQERRRADRLQQTLTEAPLSAAAAAQNAPVSPPPDDVQSVSSWSLMSGENGNGNGSSASPAPAGGATGSAGSAGSPVDTETVSLLARITRLQEEKWRVEEKLHHLEENSGALADDLANKAALIQFYCMEGRATAPAAASDRRRDSKPGAAAEAAVVTPVKKLVDFVKHLSVDDQQREMQRRMQRMLEETLTRNMHLQQDLQTMSQQLQTLKDGGAAADDDAPH